MNRFLSGALIITLFFNTAKSLTLSGQYEESQALLSVLKESQVDDPVEYHFYKFVNAFKLLDKKAAEKEAEFFEDNILPITRRHKAVADLMRWELETWKEKDLGDISRKMAKVQNRLENKKAGPETQRLQKEILKDLDALIKEKEDKLNQAQQQAAQAKQEKDKRKGDKSNNPLDDIQLQKGSAKGEIDLKKFKEYADVWGKLPEKERAKAMTDLTRGMPPKYRDAIEAYFKQLEKRSSK